MRITLAQLNPTIGDFRGNLEKLEKATKKASKEKSDLIIFSELFITGYPPRDLLEKKDFIEAALKSTQKVVKISSKYPKTGILFGNVSKLKNKIYNSAILVYQGKVAFTQNKSCPPRRDVFDEPRYFEPAKKIEVFNFKKEKLGISICADLWTGLEWLNEDSFSPIKILSQKGASIFLNLSASPFFVGKEKIRFRLLRDQSKKYKSPFFYVNQVGGNDELIFDGQSMVFNKKGKLTTLLPLFKEDIRTIDTLKLKPIPFPKSKEMNLIHEALLLGIRDYFKKCGFKKAIVGLSGGIDSSVTCALGAEALGKENIMGVGMPSQFSSKASVGDARKLAKNLGIKFMVIPITQIYKSYLNSLKKILGKKKEVTVVEENIQARIRCAILMALSNKTGALVLSTGDKSELSVGYCTLYGDLTGGLAVISDVPKTKVYQLATFINRKKEIIPQHILKKPPTPELRPEQLAEKDLIPYKILDPIIKFYIEEKLSEKEIIKKGFSPKYVKWAIHKIDKNEFKRRQAPPGLRVTSKAFGIGRRMPVAAKYNYE